MLRSADRDDDGSILVMVIGYTVIAAVLIIVGIDVSKVFLARRALAAAADSAAIAGAQGIDRQAVYGGAGLPCGSPLPLSRSDAAARAQASVEGDRDDLRRTFASLGDPQTDVRGATVTVDLSGRVAVPFGRVLEWLAPSHRNGEVTVAESSSAQSPVTGGAC